MNVVRENERKIHILQRYNLLMLLDDIFMTRTQCGSLYIFLQLFYTKKKHQYNFLNPHLQTLCSR